MHPNTQTHFTMKTYSLFSLTNIILSFLLLFLDTALSSNGFSADLIHRDSPLSPLYDPASTRISRLRSSVLRSQTRSAYFNVRAKILPNSFEYLMTISLGTPPIKSLAIVDTGSDLIWLQCAPCRECYKQHYPLFVPDNSSSYNSISCDDSTCSALPQHEECAYESTCNYEYSYGDRSYVLGELATETFSFDDDRNGKQVHIPNIVFGCTHESNGTFDANGAGLVGLAGGQLSLITQLGNVVDNKFSYCLPSLNNKSLSGKINFGSYADVSGPNSVVMDIIRRDSDSFFFLNLEKISVAGDLEPIIILKSDQDYSQEEGNIIIDSGTTLTLIEDETLQSLIAKLSQVVKLTQVSDPQRMFSLCFDISEQNESKNDVMLPNITFHFSGEADVVLPPDNTFIELDEKTLCLAIISSDSVGGISIFGNVAQQKFNVGYDLNSMKLTMQPADCTFV